jgi:hypothetical protein
MGRQSADTAEIDRPGIYGDYTAPGLASPVSVWHIQGDQSDRALCGTRLNGYLRRMVLHVSLLECSRCMALGAERADDDTTSTVLTAPTVARHG